MLMSGRNSKPNNDVKYVPQPKVNMWRLVIVKLIFYFIVVIPSIIVGGSLLIVVGYFFYVLVRLAGCIIGLDCSPPNHFRNW